MVWNSHCNRGFGRSHRFLAKYIIAKHLWAFQPDFHQVNSAKSSSFRQQFLTKTGILARFPHIYGIEQPRSSLKSEQKLKGFLCSFR